MSFSGAFYIHLIAVVCADVLLLLAGISACFYLLKHKELKKKSLKQYSIILPSLNKIDQLNAILINAGFILFTVGLIFGSYLAANTWGPYWYLDPKMVWSFSAFFIFLFLSTSRLATGFRGRTAALLTIAGTALVFGGLAFLPFCPQTKHVQTFISLTSKLV